MSTKKDEKIAKQSFPEIIWKDPVWSKVISAGIIALCIIIYSAFEALFKEKNITETLIATLNIQLSLYWFLVIFSALAALGLLYRWWLKKRNMILGGFDTEEKIGCFTFRELYNALLSTEVTNIENLEINEGNNNLLLFFFLFHKDLNIGVKSGEKNEIQRYLYKVLCPMLMSYKLVELVNDGYNQVIKTSELGYEFYALFERYRVDNSKDYFKTTKIKTNNVKPII